VRYRITADKPTNPFTQRVFNGFALPSTLLQNTPAVAVGVPVEKPAPAVPTRQ
jgi:type VI secretion system protein ImpL